MPADEVREVIESELGASVEEEFASFDFEPLAAASIGQTHRAVLKTGEHVVVKVQRPGIEDIVHRDAAVLRMAAEHRRAAGRSGARSSASSGWPRSSSTSLERELDYGAEAVERHRASSSTSRTTTGSRRRRCTSRSRRDACW